MHASLMNFFTLSFSFIEIENVYQFINSEQKNRSILPQAKPGYLACKYHKNE